MAEDAICTATYSRPHYLAREPQKKNTNSKRHPNKEMMTWLEMYKNYKNIESSNRSVVPQIQQ